MPTVEGGVIAGGYFQGTIEVGGKEYTSKGEKDGIIIKYKPVETEEKYEVEWVETYGGSSDDHINSVAGTAEGGVIVGGQFEGIIEVGGKKYTCEGSWDDGIIIKYGAGGEVEWVAATAGDSINSVATTADGGWIAGGREIIIKYKPIETEEEYKVEWVATGGGYNNCINSVVETEDGGVIAGGQFYDTIEIGENIYTSKGYGDGIIIKYSEKELVSPKIVSSTIVGGSDWDEITSVVPIADGGVIAGGHFQGTIEVGGKEYTSNGTQTDGIIIKYSAVGEVEWVATYGGSNGDSINSIAITADGGYIAGGYFWYETEVGGKEYTSKGNEDGIIIKYSAEGEVEWVAIFDRIINTVTPTTDGGVIAGGDGMTIKYSAVGEVEWVTAYAEIVGYYINLVATTADGGVIVGGYFYGTIEVGGKGYTSKGDYDGIIIKYSSDGEVEWVETFGGSSEDKINSVAVTANGGVIAGGKFWGTIEVGGKEYTSNGQDGIIIKYSEEGEVEWVETVDITISSVAPTADGGVIAGGYFQETTEVGGKEYTSKGYWDGIIIKYSAVGEVEWVATYGGSDDDRITSVAPTADGGVIAGGCFWGTIEVGDKEYTGEGYFDGIVMKVVAYAGVPETEVLSVENTRKEFKITTDVQEIDGVKGGSISGESKSTYEKVKYGDNSTKEITMTPDENYEIISITVNGKEWPFTANEDGTYTMPQFESMTENKHVVVTYALKDNKIVINKIDSKTKEPISGVKFKLDQIEERNNPENVIGALTDNGGPYTKIELSENEVGGTLGELTGNGKIDTTVECTNEVTGVIGELTNNGDSGYYFIKNEDGTYVSSNSDKDNTTEECNDTIANSYIPIDLTGLTGTYAVKVNANVSSESGCDIGYATIREDTTVPGYDDSTGQFINISGTEGGEYTSGILPGGHTYYLHLGYRKDGSVYDGDDQIVFSNIKIYEATFSEVACNFVEENESYKSSNQGQADTVCNSYIPIDLTGLTGIYAVVVNANVSSESGCDIGYATIREDTVAPAYDDSTGQFINISGTESAKDYTSIALPGEKIYYLHLGYYKDSSTDEEEDTFTINSVKVYEAIENSCTYNFVNESGKYKSSNQGEADTVCNSYVPIDLTGYTGTYKLIVNAEISSQWGDYGYATVTTTETRPEYDDSTGKFIDISGIQDAEDYTTILPGGYIYYLHLGYYKDSSTDEGEDTFTVNSIKIELNEDDLYHIEIMTNSDGQAINQIPFGKYTLTEVNPKEGYQPLEKPVIIEFKGDNRTVLENENKESITVNENGEFVVENIPKAKVVVHHYLKDRNGEYTTTKVAEDEVVYGDYDKWYTTQPHLDLDKYDLEKDSDGQYVIPENATGEFKEENEDVIYYYEERQYPVIVHHYIKGTMTPVPLADGTTAKGEEILGYVGDAYVTNRHENLAYGYEYESVEGVVSGSHIAGTIEVTYYYKVFTDVEVVKKWDNTNNKYNKPDSVTVELLADGVVLQEITLNRENKVEVEGEPETQETWIYTATKLPKYDDKDNHEIVYTVREK